MIRRAARAALGFVLASALASCGSDGADDEGASLASPQATTPAAGPPFVPGELLVQFVPGATAVDHARVRAKVGGALREAILTRPMRAAGRGELHVLAIPALADPRADPRAAPRADPRAVARVLGADAAVEFAEPNWVYRHHEVSNDTYFTSGQLWGMYGDASTPANAFGSHAAEAWAAGHVCDASVYVGVIDEGIFLGHQDLAANVWTNPYDPVDGVDNDGNGYVDDVHGWDFNRNEPLVDNGAMTHGTHVAGTIGAIGGNGGGVAGVCWRVTIIPAQFLGKAGGRTSDAVKAVDYLTDLKSDHGLRIVASNNSWGGGGFSPSLRDAIERARQHDILFVAAAGNESSDLDAAPGYPASYANANVIAVAAIAKDGSLAGFSNFGATQVDLGAPGVSILSTIPGKRGASAYGSMSGTSMAAPHVTGAVALYASTHEKATAADIKAAILGSTVATPSLAGKCVTGGRLDVSGF